MKTETFTIQSFFPENVSDDVKKYQYERMREKVGCQLLNVLYKFTLPCVVDVEEIDEPSELFGSIGEECKIVVSFTPVERRQVVMEYVVPSYSYIGRKSLWKRLWSALKNEI